MVADLHLYLTEPPLAAVIAESKRVLLLMAVFAELPISAVVTPFAVVTEVT